jgi:trimeric autotransporter adhesin
VAYGNGLFVGVGYYGSILTSIDGSTWSVSDSLTAVALYSVTYGNNQFVAVGYKGTILKSSDGVKWTKNTIDTTINLHSVVYGDNKFITVGIKGIIQRYQVHSEAMDGWRARRSEVRHLF